MKRLLLLAGAVFFMTACGNSKVLDETKEETTEAAQTTETTEAPTTEAPTTETVTTEAITTEAVTTEAASEGDDKWKDSENNSDNKSENTSSTSPEQSNSEFLVTHSENKNVIDEVKDAKVTDKHIEDILKPREDVKSYVSTADLKVATYTAAGAEDSSNIVNMRAQVNEEKGTEVYTEKLDANGKIVPVAYQKNTEKYLYENGKWGRYTGTDEVYNGLYRKLFFNLKSNDKDAKVYETSKDYIIFYDGKDRMPFHTVGNQFNVELQNIKLDTFHNTLAAVVDKNSKELKHLLYIAGAKDEGDNKVVVEIAVKYTDYGKFDNKTLQSPVQ